MLRRLCFKPSTSSTCSTWVVPIKLTEPIPIALALELSPKVIEPRSCLVTLLKSCSSPFICLEQPLSRIHLYMDCQNFPVRSRRSFRNPNGFKPNELWFRNPHSLEVFGLYSYLMSKSTINIMSIMDNSIIRFIINSFIPDLCHANRVIVNPCMVNSIMIIPIRCMMMAILRMLLTQMIRKKIFDSGCFMRSRNILLRWVSQSTQVVRSLCLSKYRI